MSPLAKLKALCESHEQDPVPVGRGLTYGHLRGILRDIGALELALRERARQIEETILHQAAVLRDRGDDLGALQLELKLVTRKSQIRGAYIGVMKRHAEAARDFLLDRNVRPLRKIAQALDALEKIARTKKKEAPPSDSTPPP